mmetsp:Transcript_30640/g.49298  ORF Transcript_30640/g.49298 Transcript_30640/m.49298 type:complete len:297 (-) Transcript_30640:105-995(-)
MALLFFIFLGFSLAESDEADLGCHLLQTSSEARRKKGNQNLTTLTTNWPVTPLQPLAGPASRNAGICLSQIEPDAKGVPEAWTRPIEEIIQHYGEDGWCLLGSMGSWASNCSISRKSRDIIPYIQQYEGDLADRMNSDKASAVTLTFSDGRTLRTRDHHYPLDDVYCFVNGWYTAPDHPERQALMNFSYLEEVSDKACSHLEKILPEYHSLSASKLSVESTIDEAALEIAEATSGRLQIPDSVVRGLMVHAAVKCVMRGGGRGAVCDIANCAARACLDDANHVLYTQRGECKKVTP